MTKIKISGAIGEDCLASDVTKQIDAARGDNLAVEINSVGGSVFQGTEVFNNLRAYGKRYPGASIEITVVGVAASMASYVAAIPGARVVAYDNAVMMLHNPSNLAMGDYRDMRKNSAFLEGLARLMRKAYAERSGKSISEIAKMMDETTWLFGDQLREEGFVDEIIPAPDSEENGDPESAVASAQLRFTEMISEQRSRGLKEDETRVAAVFQEVIKSTEEEKHNMTEREHYNAVKETIRTIASDANLDPVDKAVQLARLQQAAKVAAIPDGMYQKGGKTILDFTDEDGLIDYAAASAWFAQFDHNGNRLLTEV